MQGWVLLLSCELAVQPPSPRPQRERILTCNPPPTSPACVCLCAPAAAALAMSGVALMGQPLKVELASEAKRAAEAATAVRHLPPCGQLQCFLCPGACLFCA